MVRLWMKIPLQTGFEGSFFPHLPIFIQKSSLFSNRKKRQSIENKGFFVLKSKKES